MGAASHKTGEDQQLKGQLTGKNTVHTFIPKSNTEFSIPALQANIRFKEDQEGPIELIMEKGGRTIIAKRIKEAISENTNLEEYEGTFFSKELNAIYTLEKEDGRLLAKNKKTGDIKLSLEKKDLFTGSEWFFKEVEILRDSNEQVKGFEVSGSGNEGIVFEKMECQ